MNVEKKRHFADSSASVHMPNRGPLSTGNVSHMAVAETNDESMLRNEYST